MKHTTPVRKTHIEQVRSDLNAIKRAIADGRLDDVITLTKYNDGYGTPKHQMTMTELDVHIQERRQSKIKSIDFARNTLDLLGKYLRANFKYSSNENGYTPNMIFSQISQSDFNKLVQVLTKTLEEIKQSPRVTNFVYGQFNNQYGVPETKEEVIQMLAYQKLKSRYGGAKICLICWNPLIVVNVETSWNMSGASRTTKYFVLNVGPRLPIFEQVLSHIFSDRACCSKPNLF